MMNLYFSQKLISRTPSVCFTFNLMVCIIKLFAFPPQLSHYVARAMKKDGSLHEITTGKWNLSQNSSFLHNRDTQMCLPGRESNNVGVDFNKHMKKWPILLGLVHEGRVSWLTENLHFSTPPTLPV